MLTKTLHPTVELLAEIATQPCNTRDVERVKATSTLRRREPLSTTSSVVQ
jgi:hypothetical protein